MPKNFSSIINISSIIKTFKYFYLFLNIGRVSSFGLLYSHDFNPDLTGRWNAECHIISLIPVTAFLVDAVTRTDGWSRLWLGYFRTRLTYWVIALIKKLFPTLAPPLKNIWNKLGGNSLFVYANLQCNAYCITKLNRCCWPSSSFIKLFIRK